MDFKSASKTLILALVSGLLALPALAQWQWIDKDGRKVFSDRAPPLEIPQKNILKQPAHRIAADDSAPPASAPVPALAATASAPALKASMPTPSGKDAELEAKKKQAEQEEAAEKKAAEDKQKKIKADNCARAQRNLITMQSGLRVAVTNAQGEQEVMDDAARALETKRLQGMVRNDCKR
ncbi:MAG: DUF4124 domain-containing protein [Pseudomonadota bacterium]|nr:DUF4124 domain-containing protein [Pseudomonadota bacterium]